jgi:hypothetical protein
MPKSTVWFIINKKKLPVNSIMSKDPVDILPQITLTNRCLYVASLLYIACLFTVILFLYLPIVHLIPYLHYWLEPVSKHFTVRSTPVVFSARDK